MLANRLEQAKQHAGTRCKHVTHAQTQLHLTMVQSRPEPRRYFSACTYKHSTTIVDQRNHVLANDQLPECTCMRRMQWGHDMRPLWHNYLEYSKTWLGKCFAKERYGSMGKQCWTKRNSGQIRSRNRECLWQSTSLAKSCCVFQLCLWFVCSTGSISQKLTENIQELPSPAMSNCNCYYTSALKSTLSFWSRTPPNRLSTMKLGLVPWPASLPLVSRLDMSTNFFTPAFFAASTRWSVPCKKIIVIRHLWYTYMLSYLL